MMTVEAVPSLAAVGSDWDEVLAAAGVQGSRAWFAASAQAVPADATPCFVLVRDGGRPSAVLPLLAGPGRRLASFTTPYTCLYQPALARSADARRVGAAFGRWCRTWPVTMLEAMDADWPALPSFLAGLGAAGLAVRRYAHFGNWHLPVAGLDWDRYLETRPGQLRETIRRRARAAGRRAGMRLELVADAGHLGSALDAYERVHASSWKEPEPFPCFNRALVAALGPSGTMRIGVMWVDEVPAAAQYWTVADGTATVLKLAHDEAFKALSPGTVLTAHVIRALLAGGVRELDFGRGDDGYKQGWAGQRRERIGLLLAAPWRPAGLLALARHDLGGLRRQIQRSFGGWRSK